MPRPGATAVFSDDMANQTRHILAEHSELEGPLLPVLHGIQAAFGYIPQEALPIIAQALALSRAEVAGVVSFYHDFRSAPAGRHVLRLCRAEACQAMGADGLAARVQTRLGIGWGDTTPDGRITLEQVFCLGLCACAPAALLDDTPLGRVDDAIIANLIGQGAGA